MNSKDLPTETELDQMEQEIVKASSFFRHVPADMLDDSYKQPAVVEKLMAAINNVKATRDKLVETRQSLLVALVRREPNDDKLMHLFKDHFIARHTTRRQELFMATIMRETQVPDEYVKMLFPEGLPK